MISARPICQSERLAFLRDAWIAAKFGSLWDAVKVRLVLGDWPDFELLVAGRVDIFEAGKANDPERRRGIEYLEGIGDASAQNAVMDGDSRKIPRPCA